MKDTKQNQKVNFKSRATDKEFDPVETLEQIQKRLREYNFDKDTVGTLSDRIRYQIATFQLVIDGLGYQYDNEELGDVLNTDTFIAINNEWYDLKELIKEREEEHSLIFNLALHGEESLDLRPINQTKS